jgi:hypothetical protein
MNRTAPALVAILALTALPALARPAGAQSEKSPPAAEKAPETAAKPLLALEGLIVEPSNPGTETLCRLRVKIANHGEKIASAFAFKVEVAGHELPVYRNEVFMKPVPAGKTVELALYNFWTSETGRPAPTDGKLPVQVTLREARPVVTSVTVPLKKTPK